MLNNIYKYSGKMTGKFNNISVEGLNQPDHPLQNWLDKQRESMAHQSVMKLNQKWNVL